MNNYICKTCGTQFKESSYSPDSCPICRDERQYVGLNGQSWITLKRLKQEGYNNLWKQEAPGLIGIGISPSFAIGQRALLIQTQKGNVLWDCIPFMDEETIEKVKSLGGLNAIAISHPHFYSSMVEWAHVFDCPIYLHEADRQWVMRPNEKIVFWSGNELKLNSNVVLLRLGGHFEGSAVLHWKEGANGKGSLLTGDTIYVVADRQWASFMYSYPNLIPLSTEKIKTLIRRLGDYEFENLYAAWFDAVIQKDARGRVLKSAERYIKAIR
ncbi:MBL fold metallo-hydrolase [Xanthovirga aplysinae]|uniref:MBL fold metallo-hydrolase n=1 Tax=Xanthovirga aplysinae TaxID=2529853 RepID=UPI0012BBE682|nr:MBL fold metallo-hydrolase [Xanthovirga aplysinae]MTI29808.1 MBL fold metallo-hydrolase [Xanthovirga aplysinae]